MRGDSLPSLWFFSVFLLMAHAVACSCIFVSWFFASVDPDVAWFGFMRRGFDHALFWGGFENSVDARATIGNQQVASF